MSNNGKFLNSENIARKVFDPATDAIRTTSDGVTEVAISAADGDNIAIMNSDGSPITLANPLPVAATFAGEIEIKNDSGNPIPISDAGSSITVDAVDLDIRNLTFASDKTDVTGSDITVSNTVTVSSTNLDVRDLVFATDKVDVSGSTVSVDNFPAAPAIQDVNIVSSVELEIKNDAGNPIPVSGTVELGATTLSALESITVQNPAGVGAVNVQDGGNSLTVDAVDLDIRNLTFAQDKVDASGSTVALDAPTLAALETTSTANGALETTQLQNLTELQSINSELDSQTVLLNNIDQSTNDIETATESLNTKFDVNLSTRNAETTQQQVLGELQAANTSLDNIESDADAIRIATQSIDTDFDVALSTRASEATQELNRLELVDVNSELNTQTTILQNIDQSTNDIETRLETFNTNAGATGADTLRTAANTYDASGLPIESTIANGKRGLDVNVIKPVPDSVISALNSTTTLLGVGATFTGVFESTLPYDSISVIVHANTSSSVDGLVIELSSNGTDVDAKHEYTHVGSSVDGEAIILPTKSAFVRVKYTNDGVAQTTFRLQTIFHPFPAGPTSKIGTGISDTSAALITRSVIAGKTTAGGGSYVNVKVSPSGALAVDATVTSSVLPTGASTSALQTTGNTSLSSIDTKLTSQATAANQVTAQASLTSIDGKLANNYGVATGAIRTASQIGNASGAADFNAGSTSAQTLRVASNDYSLNPAGTLIQAKQTGIDAANSSTANLGIGATFTGSFVDVSGYSTLSILVFANQASATNGLIIEFSTDGATVHDNDFYTISASSGQQISIPLVGQFYRIRYTNGGVAQTVFALQAKLHLTAPKPSSHRVGDQVNIEQDAELVKASLTGFVLTPAAPAAATVGVASASALAANANRKGLRITNTSANIVSLGLGATAVLNSGITLYPGGVWNMDAFDSTTAAINAIASAASSNISIQEFN